MCRVIGMVVLLALATKGVVTIVEEQKELRRRANASRE